MELIFDEAELHLAIERRNEETAAVAGYSRKKRSGGVEEILPENVPVEAVEYRLPERELPCPRCDAADVVRRNALHFPVAAVIGVFEPGGACQRQACAGMEISGQRNSRHHTKKQYEAQKQRRQIMRCRNEGFENKW